MQDEESINFDLEKLKAGTQGEFIQIPEEIKTKQSFFYWLDSISLTGFDGSFSQN